MKKTTKKLLLILAAMTLVVCMAFSASAVIDNYGELELNERVTFTFTYDDDENYIEHLVSFTPAESGNYCIQSYNYYGLDPYVYYFGTDLDAVYDWDHDGYNDDGDEGLDFYYSTYMYAGDTYYFVCTENGREDTGSYDVDITKVCYHEHTRSVAAVAATCTVPGKTASTVCVDCGAIVSGGYTIPARHTDADNNLYCDRCRAKIAMVANGNCGSKATYEYYNSGLLKIKGTGTFNTNYFSDVSRGAILSVVIDNGITEIPSSAFNSCNALTNITIPASVGYIGNGAFSGCEALASITIPETVTGIYYNTFRNCKALRTINIPANIVSIDASAFYGCDALTKFTVAAANENYSADAAGVLYDYDKEELIAYPSASTATTFTVPTTVESVYSDVFDYARNLKKLIVYDYNLGISLYGTYIEEVVAYPYSAMQEIADDYGVKFTPIGNVTYSGIKIKKAPYKTVYALQDEFSTAGMELVAVMSNGAEVKLNPGRAERDCYTLTKGGAITVTFTFKQKMATTQVQVVDPSNFTMALNTPKAVVGTYNYLYFTPTVTDDYLITVGTETGGNIEVGRYRNTDSEGIDEYREIAYNSFSKDSTAKECSVRLIKGVKYRIAVSLYEDDELNLSTIGANVKIEFDCDHKNVKNYPQQNPTCTAKGYAAGTYCSDCKKWTKGHDEIAALGHSIVASHISAPATMKANGLATGKCAVCNAVLNQATVAKIKSVKLEKTKIDYNGKMKKPAVIATDANGKVLVEGTDFVTLYSSGRKEIGTYSVTVKFINNYSGTKELKFKIVFGTAKVSAKKATDDSITVSWTKVPSAKSYELYSSTNGKTWKKVGTTKTTSLEVKGLKAATGYKFKVTALSATEESTSKVVSLATALDKTVSIGAVKAGAGQFTANWKTASGVTGYEVVYSTTKKFTAKSTKTANVKKAKMKKKAVKGLKSGKYFVKVRAYKTINGAKAYGAFSKVKTVKVK